MNDEHKCFLELGEEAKYAKDCDGCGRTIPLGGKYVWNIESCCGGGCTRCLCKDCVDAAHNMLV